MLELTGWKCKMSMINMLRSFRNIVDDMQGQMGERNLKKAQNSALTTKNTATEIKGLFKDLLE